MRSLFPQKLLDVLSRRLKEKSMVYRHDEFKDITEIVKVRRCLIFHPRFLSDSIRWILVQPNMLTVAFPRGPFWDPYCLILTVMTYFISSKRRSCLTMLMMISCIFLILIQLFWIQILANVLDSGKCFWILGRVFGFWEVFLDSGTWFWILGSVLESGKCFVLTSHRIKRQYQKPERG